MIDVKLCGTFTRSEFRFEVKRRLESSRGDTGWLVIIYPAGPGDQIKLDTDRESQILRIAIPPYFHLLKPAVYAKTFAKMVQAAMRDLSRKL